MAIISFENTEYQQGEAVVWKTEVEGKVATIWFKLEDGRIIRETYRTGFPNEKKRLKEVAKIFFGDDVSGRVDLRKMVGQACYVELEERPWGNRIWIGVREVFPIESELQYEYEGDPEPEYAGYDEYEPEYEYEQPLQSGGLSENTVIRPRKILQKPKADAEPEKPLVQPERKSPLAVTGVGGSGKPRTRPIPVPRKPMEARTMLEEEDV